MLTDRGRWILAFGGAVYLAAWAFGTTALYPIGLGLVLAVAAAALWVRLLNRPMRVNRTLGKGEHLAGDDIPVRIEIDVGGRMPSGALTVVEHIAKFGEVETVILSRHGRLRGAYILDAVPRGRYPIEAAKAVLEDPFGLERVEIRSLPASPSSSTHASSTSTRSSRTPGRARSKGAGSCSAGRPASTSIRCATTSRESRFGACTGRRRPGAGT